MHTEKNETKDKATQTPKEEMKHTPTGQCSVAVDATIDNNNNNSNINNNGIVVGSMVDPKIMSDANCYVFPVDGMHAHWLFHIFE